MACGCFGAEILHLLVTGPAELHAGPFVWLRNAGWIRHVWTSGHRRTERFLHAAADFRKETIMKKPLATVALVAVALLGVASLGCAAAPTGNTPTRHAYGTNSEYGYGYSARHVRYDDGHAPRWGARDRMCDHNWFARIRPRHHDNGYHRADYCD